MQIQTPPLSTDLLLDYVLFSRTYDVANCVHTHTHNQIRIIFKKVYSSDSFNWKNRPVKNSEVKNKLLIYCERKIIF